MPGRERPTIQADRILKRGSPEQLTIEAEKTRLAHELGNSSGLFHAPRVIAVDADAGSLELDRLTGIRQLSSVVGRDADWEEIMIGVGRAVAVVHDQMRMPASLARSMPEAWRVGSGDPVALHGDLTVWNVHVADTEPRPVLLDWSFAPRLGLDATIGPREFDLTCLMRSCFFVKRPLAIVSSFPARRAAELLLHGYFDGSSHRPVPADFARDMRLVGERLTREVLRRIPMRLKARLGYEWRARRYQRFSSGSEFAEICRRVLTHS